MKNLPYTPDPQPPRFQPLGWKTTIVTEIILLFTSYFILKTSVMLFADSFLIPQNSLWHMTGNSDITFPHHYNYPAPFPDCSLSLLSPHAPQLTDHLCPIKSEISLNLLLDSILLPIIYLCPELPPHFLPMYPLQKFYRDIYLNHTELSDKHREKWHCTLWEFLANKYSVV